MNRKTNLRNKAVTLVYKRISALSVKVLSEHTTETQREIYLSDIADWQNKLDTMLKELPKFFPETITKNY